MKIPAGTQSGNVFRLKGKGAPDLRGYGRGDQLVRVAVETPRKLTAKPTRAARGVRQGERRGGPPHLQGVLRQGEGDVRLARRAGRAVPPPLCRPRGADKAARQAMQRSEPTRMERHPAEHVDVLIVGAGLSGVGAAVHLHQKCPGKSYVDPRRARRRWAAPGTSSAIRASAPTATCTRSATASNPGARRRRSPTARRSSSYVKETAAEYGVDEHIRYQHLATTASWSSEDATWTVEARRGDTGETVRFTCNFLLHVRRLLQLPPGLHARVRGHRAASRARSSIRRSGPRTSTTRARRSS